MELDALRQFILGASRATYASGDASIKERQPDNSTTIRFEQGEFRYHDNYFGGEPYGGREVVFHNDKPVWMMVYYGLVDAGVPKQDVYPFLMESLSQATLDMPYRGPADYRRGDYRYENLLEGDLDSFSGIEKIFRDKECIYEARYMGGLIDQ
ncbi:MAG: hypothetical protein AB199_01770 [Parcubacteria bacterium C7867-004]|nr:MAG: hypothetical protein AB199_01770 [Parcubacteria bacterium C7867-004]